MKLPMPTGNALATARSASRLAALASVPFTLLLLGMAAVVVACLPYADDAAAHQAIHDDLLPWLRDLLKPEPLERRVYAALVLSLPLLAWVGLWMTGRLVAQSGREAMAQILLVLVGVGGIYLLHCGESVPMVILPSSVWLEIVCLAAAVVASFDVRWTRWLRGGKRTCAFYFCIVSVVALVLLPRGLGVESIGDVHLVATRIWWVHFQAVYYPITQAVAGKDMAGSPPALYGGFHWFLAPLFKAIGLSMAGFCLVMSLLQACAMAALVSLAFRLLKSTAMAVILSLTLVWLVSTWAVPVGIWDPFFQYCPVRMIFPAASAWLVLQRQLGRWQVMLAGLLAAWSLVWNFESGLAAAGVTFSVFGLELFSRRQRSWMSLVLALVGALIGTVALCLLLPSGSVAKLMETARFQALFYQSGFCMEPMPLSPHLWQLVLLVYVIAITIAVRGGVERRVGLLERSCCGLGVMGLGLFVYYQGRSNDFNLIGASWPALLLGFVFADRLARGARARLLPRVAGFASLPLIFIALSACCMEVVSLPFIVSSGITKWAGRFQERDTPLAARIRYVRGHVGSDRECTILAQLQAVYFGETGLRSELDGPGISENCFVSDCRRINRELIEKPSRHLFADAAIIRMTGLSSALQSYRYVDSSPDGELMYFEPR